MKMKYGKGMDYKKGGMDYGKKGGMGGGMEYDHGMGMGGDQKDYTAKGGEYRKPMKVKRSK